MVRAANRARIDMYDQRVVEAVEALLTRFPEKRYEVFSLGLPSETCIGLSEPDHPWPRPNVHERLGRALERQEDLHEVRCNAQFLEFARAVLRLHRQRSIGRPSRFTSG